MGNHEKLLSKVRIETGLFKKRIEEANEILNEAVKQQTVTKFVSDLPSPLQNNDVDKFLKIMLKEADFKVFLTKEIISHYEKQLALAEDILGKEDEDNANYPKGN